jgi:hypothetical protein
MRSEIGFCVFLAKSSLVSAAQMLALHNKVKMIEDRICIDRPLLLIQGKTFPYPLWISSTVDDSKDRDCRFLHQIENFVGEPLDEVSTKPSIDGGKYQWRSL